MNTYLHAPECSRSRRCHFELMEPRRLLAADLSAGADVASLDLPDLTQPGGQTATISGNVYEAVLSSTSEAPAVLAGLPQARVQLLGPGGAVLEEQLTDADGGYQFEVVQGEYSIRQLAIEGFLDGAAQIGAAGGIALGANEVSAIRVGWGEGIAGYDFFEFANPTPQISESQVAEAAGIALLVANQGNNFTALESSTVARPETSVNTPVVVAQVPLEAPANSRAEAIFGGSSRELHPMAEIRGWDDDPFDNWLSPVSYLELAQAQPTAVQLLAPMLSDLQEEPTAVALDISLADGYTTESLDWLEGEGSFSLHQLYGQREAAEESAVPARQPTPQVARRPAKPVPQPTPVPGRTVQQQRAEAVDQAMADEAPAAPDNTVAGKSV